MNTLTKLLIVDDQEVIRAGLKDMIHSAPSFSKTLVIQARNLNEAKTYVLSEQPEIILLDYQLEINSRDGLMSWLENEEIKIPSIALFDYADIEYFEYMKKSNLIGYLLKDISTRELVSAIKQVKSGEIVVCQRLQEMIGNQLPGQIRETLHITKREQEIIGLIVRRLSSKEMSDRLFLSKRTIDKHRQNIFKKFKVNSTSALINAIRISVCITISFTSSLDILLIT
ncbi:response regulator transcription factor [Niabella sp.]|uniref:response regulator transcription factor n=1 Tax=Niabella sp. TaxID=1962976 RepID=UPI002611C13B|nr:response regulator transcription factor [Niabella sp.]